MIKRAYYSAKISEFLQQTDAHVVGEISRHHHLDVVSEQTGAWLTQCRILRHVLPQFVDTENAIFMEFTIPRMGKRAEVIIILSGIVFVLEFKVAAKKFYSQDIQQTLDYALDLKYFHSGSHDALIVPLLIATEANELNIKSELKINTDGLAEPLCFHPNALAAFLCNCNQQAIELAQDNLKKIHNSFAWAQSLYRPTPTIIQAAKLSKAAFAELVSE